MAERAWIMGLAPDRAVPLELADQAFSAKEGGCPAFSGLGQGEVQGFVKGHDMAGIDNVFALDLDRVDRTKGVDQHLAFAADIEPEHTFAGEHRFEPLPAEINLHTFRRRDIGTALYNQAFVIQFIGHHVTG